MNLMVDFFSQIIDDSTRTIESFTSSLHILLSNPVNLQTDFAQIDSSTSFQYSKYYLNINQ